MIYIKSIIAVILLVSGQTFWKLGMNKIGSLEFNINYILKTLIDPYILIGIIMYGIATIIWLGVLAETELSKAFPIMSLSYLLIMIPAYFVFDEPITILKIGGSLLIMTGVALFLIK